MKKKPIGRIHIRVHSPALQDNNAIYRVGNLATKSDNPTELDLGSSKSEEDQTLVMLFAALALDAAKLGDNDTFKKKK